MTEARSCAQRAQRACSSALLDENRSKQKSNEMSLAGITPNAKLEKPHYHLLPQNELDRLDDTEALFVRGDRLQGGVGMRRNEKLGWSMIIKAAQMGHPVALACCFQAGKGTEKDEPRAVALLRECAERGHPVGMPITRLAIR
jgi:hypothetical protein